MDITVSILTITGAILTIMVSIMKIRQFGARKKFILDSSALVGQSKSLSRNSIRHGLTNSHVEKLRSANEDAFKDLAKEFRTDAVKQQYIVNALKEFRNGAVHRINRRGVIYVKYQEYLRQLGDPDIERELRLGEFSRTLTQEESLKLRMDIAREAEKKERDVPIPDCPDYLARFVGLIPEEVLAEFGTEEYVNHMRDELQNARLKGKSKFQVILENVYEFTIQAGKSRLRFDFRRRTSIK